MKTYLIIEINSKRIAFELDEFELNIPTDFSKLGLVKDEFKATCKTGFKRLYTLRKKGGKRDWNKFLRGLMK